MSPLSGNVSSNFIGHFCLHPPNLMRWDPDYSISHWFPYCFEKNPSACNCLNFQLFQNSLNSAPHVGISEKWCFHARRIFQNDRSGLFLGWLMSGGSAEYTWYEPDIPFFGGSRPAWTDALLALIAVQRANMLLSILELCTKKHVIPGGSWRSLYVKKKGPASMFEETSSSRAHCANLSRASSRYGHYLVVSKAFTLAHGWQASWGLSWIVALFSVRW